MKRGILVVLAGVAAAGLAVPVSLAAQPGEDARPAVDRTDPAEARRVDRVPTPRLEWSPCDTAECATVRLPMDYDEPEGATVKIGLARVRAKDPEKRIGTLFVNPGGPGLTASGQAMDAPRWLGTGVLDRFDVVGIDPRGVNSSDRNRCFTSVEDQRRSNDVWRHFPVGAAQERAYVAEAERIGRSCAANAGPLAASMSTAEAARDMDVIRRAVGDQKLTYFGLSYGTVLGQYYANMFPDRVRAIAIDGVSNARDWAGVGNGNTILDDRLRSADGAAKALTEILKRCGQAGPELCAFDDGDPVARFQKLTERLGKPIYVRRPGAEVGFVISYASLIQDMQQWMTTPDGYLDVISDAMDHWEYSDPARPPQEGPVLELPLPESYNNNHDVFRTVVCTDGRHPAKASDWVAATARLDRRAPYFGRSWGWQSAPCARDTWTLRDEDAYTGPFNRRTAAPILVVGSYWDPATNYDGAVSTAAMLPNSRLLSSANFGHTAYGTSACVTGAVDRYLVGVALPAEKTVCKGDVQPFEEPVAGARSRAQLPLGVAGGLGEPGEDTQRP